MSIVWWMRNPDEMLYDAWRNRFVVVSEKVDDDFIVVTVMYSSVLKDIVNRKKKTGRWI